ncbi:hypothetical protein Tco_0301069 [Tanacetum coccineum]
MTSDDNTSGLVPQRQMALEHNSSCPAPKLQKTYVHNSTKLKIQDHNNEPSSSKLVPNVVPTIIPPTDVNAEENNTDQAENTPFEAYEFINPFAPLGTEVVEKALYGLKQAPRAWYDKLLIFLISKGFSKAPKYALDILKKHGMDKCDSICTSMATTPKLDAHLSEVEYMALSASYAQVLWKRTQLKDHGFDYNKIPLYCDSQLAIAISYNPMQHSRTKHINVRYPFIKEHVENGIVELYFVRTEYQLADMFTKAFSKERIKHLVGRLGMRCFTQAKLEVLANETT